MSVQCLGTFSCLISHVPTSAAALLRFSSPHDLLLIPQLAVSGDGKLAFISVGPNPGVKTNVLVFRIAGGKLGVRNRTTIRTAFK